MINTWCQWLVQTQQDNDYGLDDFLGDVIRNRLERINNASTSLFTQLIASSANKYSLVIPDDIAFYRMMLPQDFQDPKEEQNIVRSVNIANRIDEFEKQIIKSVFDKIDKKKVSNHAINALRISPSLFGMLLDNKYESESNTVPEIYKPFVIIRDYLANHEETKEGIEHLEYYDTLRVAARAYLDIRYNHSKSIDRVGFCFDSETVSKANNPLVPIRITSMTPNLSSSEIQNLLSNVDFPKLIRHCKEHFIKIDGEIHKTVLTHNNLSLPNWVDDMSQTTSATTTSEDVNQIQEKNTPTVKVLKEKEEEKFSDSDESKPNVFKQKITQFYTKTKKKHFENSHVKEIPIAREVFDENPYPSFIRKSRSDLVNNPRTLQTNISPDISSFLDNLFDSKSYYNLTFKEFKKFWNKIGGKIEGEGGSHRHLIAPNGTALWGIHIDHRGGKYGPNVIQHLRAAFVWSGYRLIE